MITSLCLSAYRRILKAQDVWHGCRFLPYGVVTGTLAAILRLPIDTRVRNRRQIARLLQLASEAGVRVSDDDIRRYLQMNMLTKFRYCWLARCSDKAFSHWVHSTGIETIDALQRQGRPVLLLTAHLGPGHAISLALQRRGHTVHTVTTEDVFRTECGCGTDTMSRIHAIEVGKDSSPMMIKTTNAVRRLLRDGAIVHAALDGFHGQGGQDTSYLGRQRQLRMALPYAAAMANAAVVLVAASVAGDGTVRIVFHQPLADREPGQEMACRARFIASRYIEFSEDKWRQDPGNIPAHMVREMLAFPPATSRNE